ncbi:MAG: ABC-2 family transporter protein [Chthonomonas sp.]|nr:ABC-2 family transporter protein [Chthonomonas sp.]
MRRTFWHHWAITRVYLREGRAYPAVWVIWLLTDAVSMFAMPLVLSAASGSGTLGGYDSAGFFRYFAVLLFCTSFIQSHFMWEMGQEIKEGIFSAQIVRPISHFRFTFMRNLAWRVWRTLFTIPALIIYGLVYANRFSLGSLNLGPQFLTALVLGHILSITFVIAFGLIALYLEDCSTVFELYYFPMMFLSGQLFPVSMLPQWAQNLIYAFPFFFTTGVPTEIAIGKLQGDHAWMMILGQVAWILGSIVLLRVLWRGGIKRYTGVGM